jgi:putative sigma-54 modulation protein
MEIKIQSIRFDADKKLLAFVNEKINKLPQFFDDIIDAEVFLRLENNDTGENKIAELKLNLPGKTLFSKEQSRTFEKAIDESVEAMKRQLAKHKEKLRGV